MTRSLGEKVGTAMTIMQYYAFTYFFNKCRQYRNPEFIPEFDFQKRYTLNFIKFKVDIQNVYLQKDKKTQNNTFKTKNNKSSNLLEFLIMINGFHKFLYFSMLLIKVAFRNEINIKARIQTLTCKSVQHH